ncbi:unnamed protein product [Larinioides sclopetarius]|uniref:Secreted protein n=1 Tax=Larinioides sclopetarius TaxID=280406 RepID=A0AAV2AWR6_9ARAC
MFWREKMDSGGFTSLWKLLPMLLVVVRLFFSSQSPRAALIIRRCTCVTEGHVRDQSFERDVVMVVKGFEICAKVKEINVLKKRRIDHMLLRREFIMAIKQVIIDCDRQSPEAFFRFSMTLRERSARSSNLAVSFKKIFSHHILQYVLMSDPLTISMGLRVMTLSFCSNSYPFDIPLAVAGKER